MSEKLLREAVLLMKLAKWDEEEIIKALNELGFNVNGVKEFKIPKTPLTKSLLYYYKLALKLKRENSNYGHVGVARIISNELGINMPEMTVYFWISLKSKPNITPLRVHSELGYIIGTIMSDATWSTKVKLRVVDYEFAKEFSKALEKVKGSIK